jgi:DNA-binding IclR family transcriptional regulator
MHLGLRPGLDTLTAMRPVSAPNANAGIARLARSRSLVPAVGRAADIMDALAANQGEPLGPSELARRVGLPKSTVANICIALADVQLLRRVTGGYTLGQHLAELGGSFLAGVDEVRAFEDVSREQAAEHEDTMQLATLLTESLQVLYLARRDGTHPVRLMSNVGVRLPATTTAVGKAMLAELDPSALDESLARSETLEGLTDRSITNKADLMVELSRVRRRGFAVDDQETTLGVLCVGVAIPRRRVEDRLHALSFTLLKAQAGSGHVKTLAVELQRTAHELAARLGASVNS